MILLAFACARKALGNEGIRDASPEQCQDRMGAAQTAASPEGGGNAYGADHLDSGPPAMECLAGHGPAEFHISRCYGGVDRRRLSAFSFRFGRPRQGGRAP